jgi:Concanavalin A-like lectin/glucanases superfamily
VNTLAAHSSVFAMAVAFCLFDLTVQTGQAAILTHRYSFDADASDSIGDANGLLQGSAYITNGELILDGTNGSVQLPNDLFTNYNSISFEIWYADGAVGSPSNQLYNFSGPSGGINFLLFGQGNCRVAGSQNSISLPVPAVGGTNHLVWTQDGASQTAKIYINGALAVSSSGFTNTPAMIGSTTNNLIGAGATNISYSNFKGSILEFRTYQGAVSPLDVAVADAVGPDETNLDPGALQDVRVMVPPPAGPGALFRIGVFADFANVTNVNISTLPDLVLSSDNTNVIVVSPDQRLQTVGFGVADITASYQELSNTLAVAVGMPQDVALIHRYSFNEQTNDWIVHDSISGADGKLIGYQVLYRPGQPEISFSGNGQLNMLGYPYDNGAYVALPGGLISDLSEVSIETWVTWMGDHGALTFGQGAWQRIFDFGNQDAGVEGKTYLFLTPATDNVSFTTKSLLHTAITTNFNLSEMPRLNWTNALPTNASTFVAVTYSPVRGVMKLYLDGISVATGTAVIPLSGIIDANDWLGRSQFSADPYFSGNYDEFRIYRGLLSDADVAADYAAGPNVIGVDYVLHDFVSSNTIAITWGPSATNWFLESSPALGPDAVWTSVPGTPTFQNGRYRMTIPITGDASYFRLHAPL